MSRDKLKDQSYFENYISSTKKRIDKFMMTAEKLDTSQTEQKKKCLEVVAGLERNLINALYSAGREKKEVEGVVKEYIDIVNNNKVGINSYNDYVDILSLSVIFKIPISKTGEYSKFEDGMTEYLKSGDIEKIYNLKFADFYGAFADYITDKISTADFSSYMENKWYSTCEEFSWFDTHKSKESVYMGYWSWLAAAIMKKKAVQKEEITYVPIDFI
jgi:hypothetical protein